MGPAPQLPSLDWLASMNDTVVTMETAESYIMVHRFRPCAHSSTKSSKCRPPIVLFLQRCLLLRLLCRLSIIRSVLLSLALSYPLCWVIPNFFCESFANFNSQTLWCYCPPMCSFLWKIGERFYLFEIDSMSLFHNTLKLPIFINYQVGFLWWGSSRKYGMLSCLIHGLSPQGIGYASPCFYVSCDVYLSRYRLLQAGGHCWNGLESFCMFSLIFFYLISLAFIDNDYH